MAEKIKTEPEGIGHLFPIYDFEPISAWAGRSITALNERPSNRQFSELSPLLAQPILPRALSRLMSPLAGLELNLPSLATDHSALRYYAAFTTPALGHIIARDTVGDANIALDWKLLGISHIRNANTRLPGVCKPCLIEHGKKGQFPHWNIHFAMPGSLFCTEHRSPLLQPCRVCKRVNEKKKLWTTQIPEVRCHCGENRIEVDLGAIEDFAFGVSQDVRRLLEGAVDAYSSEQVFSVTRCRASELNLRNRSGAVRARELINENKIFEYLSIAHGLPSINESLVEVVRGNSLASTPLVNLICFRLLFGSIDEMVDVLNYEFGDGIPDRNGLPAFFQRPALDMRRLDLFRAVAENMCEEGRLTTQQSFMAAIGEEVAYAVAIDEAWLRGLFETTYSRPRRRDKNEEIRPRAETVIETGGRKLTDSDLAKTLCDGVAELQRSAPNHPQRTKGFLLEIVLQLHWTIYYRYHRRGEVPVLAAAIDEHYESKDDYRRRIYLNVAERTPKILHLDMPRSAARIQRATSEELKDWLRRLNIR